MTHTKVLTRTTIALTALVTLSLAGTTAAAARTGSSSPLSGSTALPSPGGDGSGWTAALHEGAADNGVSLTMVSPTGTIQDIGQVPTEPSPQGIAHVDADAGRVVTDDHSRDPDIDPMDDGPLRVQVWDTHTRTKRQLNLPYTYDAAYTDHRIFLGVPLSSTRCVVDMYDYDGRRQHRSAPFPCDLRAVPSVSADGTRVAVNGTDAVHVWDSRSGKQVNTFAPPRPTVQDKSWCTIDSYFDRSTSLFNCIVVGDRNYAYAVDLRTGKKRSVPYGASATVSVPDGVVTHDIVPEHNPWTLHPSAGDPVTLTAPEFTRLIGSDGSVLYLQDRNPPGTIMTYDVSTGRLVQLTDPGDDGPGFVDALTVDRFSQQPKCRGRDS